MIESARNRGRTGRWALWALACAIVLLLLPAARAEAAFTINSVTAVPNSTDAGANSDFVITVNFAATTDSNEFVKDVTIHLPPGQVADPTATPLCTVAQLNAGNCPSNTQVGAVHTVVTIAGIITQPVDGEIYNLTPQTGEPARFGIILRPSIGSPIILQSAAKLRSTDYGLDSILNGIPNSAMGLSTHIDTMQVTLHGKPGTGSKTFSRNPTSCSQATTTVDATSYGGGTATGNGSYTPTNCAALDFSPTFSSTVGAAGQTAIASHPPLETVVDQDAGEAGVRNVTALLPAGVSADPVALNNHCPVADFQAGTCPAKSIVGSAIAESPFLTQPLAGPVALVEPLPNEVLPRLGLDLQGPLHIQLFGSFVLLPGQAGNAFMDIPDIPLSHFVLDFDPGKLVALSRDLCTGAPPKFGTDFTGWNGGTRKGDVAATVEGCGGGKARPKAKAKVRGASSDHPHLKLTVTDRAKVKRTTLKLPKGLAFAGGKDTKRGVKIKGGKLLKAKGRTLKAKGRGTKLVEKAVKHALVRTRKLAGKKLHLKLAVTDGVGKTTKLKLTAKAKP